VASARLYAGACTIDRVLAGVYRRTHKRLVAPALTASHGKRTGLRELSSSPDTKYGREAIGFQCKVIEQCGVARAEGEAAGCFRSCPAQLWIADEQTRLALTRDGTVVGVHNGGAGAPLWYRVGRIR